MGKHNAQVVAYSAHPEDMRLTVKIECGDHEWGWATDGPGVYDRLAAMAREHNEAEQHRAALAAQNDHYTATSMQDDAGEGES